MLLRLGFNASKRSISLALLRPNVCHFSRASSPFFSPNRSLWTRSQALSNSFKKELRRQYQATRVNWTRSFATFTDTAYNRGRSSNRNGDGGSKREEPHYNNTMNNIVKPTGFFAAFSAAVYYGSPYLFDNTPMSYFKQNPRALVYGIIGLNVLVFGLWQLRYNSPSLYRILENYFLLDRNSLTRKSNWSMVLSTFSHQEFFHLFLNMACLWSFSETMLRVMGVSGFTSLYLISGCGASLASLIFSFLTKTYGCSLGASGAISGVFAAFAAVFPTAGVMFFVIPIPGGAQTALALFTGYNLAGMFFKWYGFDYAAHLGGTIIGYIWGLAIKERLQKHKQRYVRRT